VIGGSLGALDDALERARADRPRKVQSSKCAFWRLSVEETAEVLKVSPVTVMRDWSTAKAWLYRNWRAKRTMDSDR